MVLNTTPNVDLTIMLDRMIDTYHSIKDSEIYHPICSTIHIPRPLSNILTVTWFNDVGLWFMGSKNTPPTTHIDAQYFMDTLMHPCLGVELHALLLLLNNRLNHAFKFDHSLKTPLNLPSIRDTARYNSWSQFNDHINSLIEVRDIIHDHKR